VRQRDARHAIGEQEVEIFLGKKASEMFFHRLVN
jgi:hypothetical protein